MGNKRIISQASKEFKPHTKKTRNNKNNHIYTHIDVNK